MRRVIYSLIGCVALAGLLLAGPVREQIVKPSVVVANPDDRPNGTGTAIAVGRETLILTAAHVVAEAWDVPATTWRDGDGNEVIAAPPDRKPRPVWVYTKDRKVETKRQARLVWYDAANDLALLRPACAKGLVVAHVACPKIELDEGEDAWYCGYGGGLVQNLQKTIINQDDDEWTTVNGGGWYGHSGSGLFVSRGGKLVLVGVVVQLQNTRNPKSPIRCVTRAKIGAFLRAYRICKGGCK
jgi:S1-C subfamily serine protease